MMAITGGTDIGGGRWAAGGVVSGVVQLGGGGRAPAAGVTAVAIPDLDVASQGAAGEPGARLVVQRGPQLVAAGVLGGQVGDHPGPLPAGRGVGGQLGQHRGGDVQLDDPAALRRHRRRLGVGAGSSGRRRVTPASSR
jgi:hypothetical protein